MRARRSTELSEVVPLPVDVRVLLLEVLKDLLLFRLSQPVKTDTRRICGVKILFTATIVAERTCAISGWLDRVFAPYVKLQSRSCK